MQKRQLEKEQICLSLCSVEVVCYVRGSYGGMHVMRAGSHGRSKVCVCV